MTTDQDVRPSMTRSTLGKSVFWPAAILILGFVLYAIIWPNSAEELFDQIQSGIISGFGWYYVLIAAVFVAFTLFIGFSRFGNIRLGQDDDKPRFSLFSWFALLFAAGMGIGLVFYGVAEPLAHFASPRPGISGTPEYLAQASMTQTFLHWGIHAWSIYIVVGVAIAYAVHRRGRPVSIRWALEPLLGDRVKGRWGDVIDITAVVGTMFGVATSLGLGVLQMSSGLGSTGIAQPTTGTQIVLIGIITVFTIFSLVTGLQKGMKWLSNINLALAGAILLYVLFSGPTLFVLREFVQDVGSYIQNFVGMSFNVSAYAGEAGEKWQAQWTTFYWGWWISWAPFVGIFIARVSKGRTVREFVWGVLLVPTSIAFLWFATLGGTAIYRELYGEGGLIGPNGEVDYDGSLFQMLEGLPGGAGAPTYGAILLIGLFFITSSDSGSLVLGMLTSGGSENPKRWLRVFWAVTTALVAISLLISGGLIALQTAAIITALPFSVVMIGMMISTIRAFQREHQDFLRGNRQDFVDHITETVGDEYGLEATSEILTVPRAKVSWLQRLGRSPEPEVRVPAPVPNSTVVSGASSDDGDSATGGSERPAFEDASTDQIVAPIEPDARA